MADESPKVPKDVKAKILDFLNAKPLPSLVVFDLDKTLWNMNIHEANLPFTLESKNVIRFPVSQLVLFDAVRPLFEALKESQIRIAIASHCPHANKATRALKMFGIWENISSDLFFCKSVQEYGSKKNHLTKILEVSGEKAGNVLFFDDLKGNMKAAQTVGVQFAHCSQGINLEIIESGFKKFRQRKKQRNLMSSFFKPSSKKRKAEIDKTNPKKKAKLQE